MKIRKLIDDVNIANLLKLLIEILYGKITFLKDEIISSVKNPIHPVYIISMDTTINV